MIMSMYSTDVWIW